MDIYRVTEYQPAKINIIISPNISVRDKALDAVMAIISPIMFIDGGAPKLKALIMKSQIIKGGKIISIPLFKNRFRVWV